MSLPFGKVIKCLRPILPNIQVQAQVHGHYDEIGLFFSLKDFIKMLDHNNSTIFCAFVCMHKLLTDLLNPLQEVTAINCFKF